MEPQSTAGDVSPPSTAAGDLRAVPLTWGHCIELSLTLPSSERMECDANGRTAIQALATGLLFGSSWAVLREYPDGCNGPDPIGAFGYTATGSIWSLWCPLTRKESVAVLRLSREWIPHLVAISGRHVLTNAVHKDNTKAIDWLIATGCINLDFANPRRNLDGSESYAFETFPPQVRPHV